MINHLYPHTRLFFRLIGLAFLAILLVLLVS